MASAVVRVLLPGALTEFADGQRELMVTTVEQPNVGDVVAALSAAYPALARRIVDETGQLRRHANLYIGLEECRRLGGLAAPIPPHADIHIIGSIAGG